MNSSYEGKGKYMIMNNIINDNDRDRTIILDCGEEVFEIRMKDLIESLKQYGYTIVRVSEIN